MSKNLATPANPIRVGNVTTVDGSELPAIMNCDKCRLSYPKHMMAVARRRSGGSMAKYNAYCHDCLVKLGILKAGAVIHIDHEKERAEETGKALREKEDAT